MRDRNLAFVDTETTGLDHGKHEIISMACVIRSPSGAELDRKEWHMHPRWLEDAEPKALEINGYSWEEWERRGVVTHEEAMREFVELTKGCMFVAHNVTFDWNMIEAELVEQELEWRGDYHKICTASMYLPMALTSNGQVEGISLRRLSEFHALPTSGLHSAMADVDRMILLFDLMLAEQQDLWNE